MEWIQVLTFIGVNVGLFGVIGAIMIYFLSRLDAHASRIDQLYQMFVDLLKEKK